MKHRYRVTALAYVNDDLPCKVTELGSSRMESQAFDMADEAYERLSKSHGYAVYNYQYIAVHDARNNEVLGMMEFDVNYMTDHQAFDMFDEKLDEKHGIVVIAGKSYRTSEALKATDVLTYLSKFNDWLEKHNIVTV